MRTLSIIEPDPERDELLAKATVAVKSALPAANSDSERPAFHFHTPANWMNDPNGPIFYKGRYHVFYQFNPYGDAWGNMHWGHGVSRDLVDWEHWPIAVWPSKAKGEEHVYSGSTFRDNDGNPLIFYTSIGKARDPEQWMAIPKDDDLRAFAKPSANPILTLALHGGDSIHEWRDPFLFREGRETYMVVGGGRGNRGVVLLYQATDPGLSVWKYRGVLFEHPDVGLRSAECPNLVRLGDRWLLLTSTHGKIESFVGMLDLDRGIFTAQNRGILVDGAYASQIVADARGAPILLAWFQPPHAPGWAGCLGLPSRLKLGSDGNPICEPLAELSRLREKSVRLRGQALSGALDLSDRLPTGDGLELALKLEPGTAASAGVRLRVAPDGTRGAEIRYDFRTRTLHTPGRAPTVLPPSPDNASLTLRLFLDKTVVDLYAAGGTVSQMAAIRDARPEDRGIQVFAEGGEARLASLEMHRLRPARFVNAF